MGVEVPGRAGDVVLEARVSKRFGGKIVLHDVVLRARRGDKIAVVGPNGTGKTTLFKIIAGLLKPSKGFVKLRGVRAVYVPELDFAPFLLLVRDWLRLHDCPLHALKERAPRLASVVESLLGRRFSRLSKGQRRLVSIAGVLCGLGNSTDHLLLLDEPFSGLGSEYKSLLGEVIRGSRATIFFSSHSVAEAVMITRRAYLLREGRLHEATVDHGARVLRVYDSGGQVVYEEEIPGLADACEIIEDYWGHGGAKKICIETA